MLTAKQEKFVRNLIEGMSQREAYKNSYDAKNMTDKTIDEKACLLFASDKIRARFKELQDELAKASIMTATERLKYLTDLVKEHEEADYNVKLKAIDIMNKMQGDYTTNTNVKVSYEDRLKEVVGEDEY